MSISKKDRFEVFKRDDFKCQYCGRTPPEITLEVDHINPKSKGGGDNYENLISACFDCNRGKGDIELCKIPNTLQNNYEILQERENQIKEYNKLLKKIEKRTNKDIYEVDKIYREVTYYGVNDLSDLYKISVRKFIDKLGLQTTKDAMVYAVNKKRFSGDPFNYFCGICHNKIRAKING